MKSSSLYMIGAVLVVAAIVLFSIPTGRSEQEYKEMVEKERQAKDEYMRASKESPFASNRSAFVGLQYFEPSIKYHTIAHLSRIEKPKPRPVTTSTGETQTYLEYGWVEFEIEGVSNKLMVLENMSTGPARGTLFLAFADETSGKETYGAGRYLDLRIVHGVTSVDLDFNKAYNPYCAYNDGYTCPLPPAENILKVPILAGEKNYPAKP